ncbi:RNA-directed DNA polymerase, eukaryota, reverse transcriptase zinc-binding domain protein [Tanacetum coccineum]|uniref:RNA-directed DNA polymerase, eukaryota, reverse transcriptase zinc-binding domain protein n=1 Tax=Tanacetum coccineum TaxID=301880 RepID=A0ABQ5A8P0_9ASTR
MYSFEDISSASRIAMAIEVKNKNGGLNIEEDVKEHIVERDNKKKVTVTTNNLNNFCEKCQISGHVKEKCWKAHPIPNLIVSKKKKWIKNDRGRRTVSTTISNDVVDLGQVEVIQVKQEVIEAIVDTGSEKNLISSSLVERLGLETTPHPRPYSLGWIKKDVDTQVNRQYCWVSTSLSMVSVKYSASVRRFVVDFLHVPLNEYSSRPNDMKQYRSSIIWCGWLLLLPCFSSTVLHLLLFIGSYITVPEYAQDTDIGLGGS